MRLSFKKIFSFLIMLACTLSGCITENEPHGPSLEVGDSLPVFSVTMNNGNVISTSSLKGKVGVIVFFNTNCNDCRKELPEIQKLWEIYKDNPQVEILPISREESNQEILAYWNENGLTMPYSAQETREVYSLFASSIIPRIFIINRDGIITSSFGDTDMPSFSNLMSLIESQN